MLTEIENNFPPVISCELHRPETAFQQQRGKLCRRDMLNACATNDSCKTVAWSLSSSSLPRILKTNIDTCERVVVIIGGRLHPD